jgi:hypothetical protein
MNHEGPRPLATPEEQARVVALAGEGKSLRAIAEAVFGDRRLKDRVHRILTRAAAGKLDLEGEALRAQLDDLYGQLGELPRRRG